MSLLADLLSKKTKGEDGPRDGKDIPPTLVRAQNAPPKSNSLKNRYVIICLVAAAFIAAGIVTSSRLGRLAPSLLQKKAVHSEQIRLPIPHKVDPGVASAGQPPVAAPMAPVVPQSTESAKTSGTPPAAKPISSAHAQKAKTLKTGISRQKRIAGAAIPSNVAARSHSAGKTSPAHASGAVKSRPQAAIPVENGASVKNSLLYAARSAELVGDWRTALASYRKALKIDPDNYKIMSNTAAALNNLGMFEEGARQAKHALAQKPDYVPALINAAIAYSSKGNSHEALLLFSAAASADPGNRNLVINLGILQERVGKFDEALETYRRLAATGDPLALQGVGRIYERKGNRTEAVNAYRQIMATGGVDPALKKEVKARLVDLEE